MPNERIVGALELFVRLLGVATTLVGIAWFPLLA
jgi:hypothetical protein